MHTLLTVLAWTGFTVAALLIIAFVVVLVEAIKQGRAERRALEYQDHAASCGPSPLCDHIHRFDVPDDVQDALLVVALAGMSADDIRRAVRAWTSAPTTTRTRECKADA